MTSDPRVISPEDFDRFLREPNDILTDIERTGVKRDVPLIGPSVGRLLYVICKMAGIKRVLELGTANGYSAIWLARAVGPDGRVTTLEFDEGMAEEARENISSAGMDKMVDVIVTDALRYISGCKDEYDMVFMDIEKEDYSQALGDCVRLLRSGGVLFADNVAFISAGDFNERLNSHPDLETAFIYGVFISHNPDKDAISISVKK